MKLDALLRICVSKDAAFTVKAVPTPFGEILSTGELPACRDIVRLKREPSALFADNLTSLNRNRPVGIPKG